MAEAGLRVLVADDSVLLREGLVRLLEEGGCEVVAQAGDAEELLRKARGHKPDMAVIDVRMPPDNTDDGLRAALAIRGEHARDGGARALAVHRGAVRRRADRRAHEGVGYLLKERVTDVGRFVDAVQPRRRRRLGDRPGGRQPQLLRRHRAAGSDRGALRPRARSARADGRGPLQPRDRRRSSWSPSGRSRST